MKIIDQSWQWEQRPEAALDVIEKAGRTCYKSEDKLTAESARKFVKMILKRGHESVIEHATAGVRFITNRGVTHELVRHRLCAFSQESTRYVNYGGDNIEFIRPVWADIQQGFWATPLPAIVDMANTRFLASCLRAEQDYKDLLKDGWRPEQAREILPNTIKTEIVVTANLREWRHIFRLRTDKAAHPQMRALMTDCLEGFRQVVPILFDTL